MSNLSIKELRTKNYYRWLEGSLAIATLSFFGFVVLLSFVNPYLITILIFCYSFIWLLKVTLICLHIIYGYKQLRRWQRVDWLELLKAFEKSKESGIGELQKVKNFSKIKEWQNKIEQDIKAFQTETNNIYHKPYNIYQFPIFAVYNESCEVLTRSLQSVYESGYPLSKICIFITQEGRMGEEHNLNFRKNIEQLTWVNTANISVLDLDTVFCSHHEQLDYNYPDFELFSIKEDKLNIVFVQHPEGLVGEIKGKASNESYAGRQISLFIKSKKIPASLSIVTSLDADSSVGKYFFHMLAYRFCATPNRARAGFQPIPAYSNNYFETHFWPRVVAANTTLWQFAQSSLQDEAKFFANYCVPLNVLQEINFWQTDIIAEDALCFTKAYCHYNGNFQVIPFYGVFNGDAVEADTYLETIENQYKQIQRWAWGGVECFPFIIQNLFFEEKGKLIPLKKRIKFSLDEFLNHFFWSTTQLIFSVGFFLPRLLGGSGFNTLPLVITIAGFGVFFTWISSILVVIFSYITLVFITNERGHSISFGTLFKITYQAVFSSLIYVLLGIPAIDSQIRGLRGNYLGYWVTPKK